MRKLLKNICVLVGVMSCLAACAKQADTPVQTAEETTGFVVEESQEITETITIIHVNDVHGYAEETDVNIGYAKIAGFIDEKKAEGGNVFALDAGDTFSGNPYAAFDGGQSIAKILMTVPFDAAVMGNNDFSLGEEGLLELTNQLPYPCLAGNVLSTSGDAPWEDYTILTTESGLNIGIVTGVNGVYSGMELQNPIERLKEQVLIVRPQVDILIGLLHMGYVDSSRNTSQLVAKEVEGIDLIVDGHSHTVLEQGEVSNDILITQAGEYGKYIGVIELSVKGKKLDSAAAKLLTYEDMANQKEKEDTKAEVEEMLEKSGVYFAQEIGETMVELTGARDLLRTQETNIGNMVTDAIREANQTEIAFAIAGGIGGEIATGPITKKDILSIGRVNSNFAIYEVTGADILELLNSKCEEFPEPSGNFLQVSGISFTLDGNQEIGERILDVLVNGEPLDLERTYTLSANEGMAKDRGIVNGTLLSVNTDFVQDIIERYIIENSPVNPKVEGRIKIIPID